MDSAFAFRKSNSLEKREFLDNFNFLELYERSNPTKYFSFKDMTLLEQAVYDFVSTECWWELPNVYRLEIPLPLKEITHTSFSKRVLKQFHDEKDPWNSENAQLFMALTQAYGYDQEIRKILKLIFDFANTYESILVNMKDILQWMVSVKPRWWFLLPNYRTIVADIPVGSRNLKIRNGKRELFFGVDTTGLDRMADTFQEIPVIIRQYLEQLCSSVKDMTSSTSECLKNINSKITESALPSFLENLSNNWPILILQLNQISKAESATDIITCVLTTLALLGLNHNVIINKLLMKKQDVETQDRAGQQESMSYTMGFAALFVSLFSKYTPTGILSSLTSKMTQSAHEMKMMEQLMEKFQGMLYEWGFDIDCPAKVVAKMREQMASAIASEVKFRTLLSSKSSSFCTQKVYKEFEKQFDIVMDINKQLNERAYSSLKDTSFAMTAGKLVISYKEMHKLITEIRSMNGSRVVPAAYMFVGLTQCGKTTFASELPKLLKKYYNENCSEDSRYDCVSDINNWTVWNQNTGDRYHQGYVGQEIHVTNDMFAAQDDHDHEDCLQFIGPNIFPTKQADNPQKGRPYNARLFIGTCNNFPMTSTSIRNPEAVWERFKLIWVENSSRQYKKNDPDDGPTTYQEMDHTFSKLTFRLVSVKEYAALKSGAPLVGLSSTACPRSAEEICKYMMDHLVQEQLSYASKLELNNELESIPCNKPNPQNRAMLFNCWYKFTEKLRNCFPKVFRKVCGIKIDNVGITEFLNTNKEYESLFRLFTYLDHNGINIPEMIDGYTIYLFSSKQEPVLVWEGDKVFRVILDKDAPTLYKFIPGEDDVKEGDEKQYYADFNNWAETQANAIKQWVVDRYRSPLFGVQFWDMLTKTVAYGSSLATYLYGYGLKGAGIVLAANAMTDLITEMIWSLLYNILPIEQYWQVVFIDWVNPMMRLILTCLGLYIAHQVNISKIANTVTICGSCEHSNIRTFLHNSCKISCYNGKHVDRCVARHYASKIICKFCKESRCQGCYHSETPPPYLQPLVDISAQEIVDYFYEDDNVEEEIDEGTVEHSAQGSGEVGKTRKTKSRLKVGSRQSIPDGQQEYTVQGHSPGSNAASKSKVKLGQQQALDMAAFSVIKSLHKRLLVQVESGYEGNNGAWTPLQKLYGIGYQRYIITPNHLRIPSDQPRKYRCYTEVGNKTVPIPLKFVNSDGLRDICVWNFPEKYAAFSSALKNHLMTTERMEEALNKERSAVFLAPSISFIQKVQVSYVSKDTFMERGRQIVYRDVLNVVGMSLHKALSNPGDCGSLIVGMDTSLTKKILGMHVAGTESNNVAAILTLDKLRELGLPIESGERELANEYELVESGFSKFPIVDPLNLIHTEEILQNGNRKFMPKGNFIYMGEMKTQLPATKSSIVPHPLKGAFEVKKAPACLNESDLKTTEGLVLDGYGNPNLLLTQTSKYGKDHSNLNIDHNLLADIKEQIIEYMVEQLENDDLGLSTDFEILNGDPSDESSHKLDTRTSAGVPWSRQGGRNLKKGAYFKVVESGTTEYRVFDDSKPHVRKLMEAINVAEELGKQGIRTVSIAKDCLKDEVRAFKKIHNPRNFKSFPFEKVYLQRKYFLKFKVAWTKKRVAMHHGVGVNPISSDWAELYNYLRSRGDSGYNIDYKEYDKNAVAVFQDVSNDIKIEVIKRVRAKSDSPMTKEEEMLMRVLTDEDVRTINVGFSTIYMDEHGNPSGSGETTVNNSILNLLYHVYAFCKIYETNDFKLFRMLVAILVFGDDVIFTCANDSKFTFENIRKVLEGDLGQKYTNADGAETADRVPLEELTFLKRRFVPTKESSLLISSPLEIDSIEQRFAYTHSHPENIQDHCNALDEAVIEAAQIGQEYYCNFQKKLKARLSQLNNDPSYDTAFRHLYVRRMRERLVAYGTARGEVIRKLSE